MGRTLLAQLFFGLSEWEEGDYILSIEQCLAMANEDVVKILLT